MGSTTYEWVVEHLKSSGEKWMYEMPAWVMTTRDLEPFPGADIRFASGGVRAVYDEMVAALAAGSASERGGSGCAAGTESDAGGKDLWVVGGGELVGQFADEGLLDEVFVCIAPVVLGAGRPLLPRRYDFELLETGRNKAFVCARYRFVGVLAEDR
jgi:dihydrofolate reductase